jgi:hypothetical protein
MTVSINGTSGLVFNDASSQNTSAFTGGFAFRNRLINSAMVIDQRNAGASVTPNNNYTLDRWVFGNSQTSKFTAQQNQGAVTPPAGFTNYLGVTSSSAYSVTSTDEFELIQYIEGFNTADLSWGTASAQTITLSFWVRSSLTGTFGGSLSNHAGNRGYAFSFVISAANTWEQKSITIAGDTTGTWQTGNLKGIALLFSLGAGSSMLATAGSWGASFPRGATGQVNLVGTSGATFYITGVQLEKGSTATSFDYRPIGTELQLAQRYFEKSYNTDVAANTNTAVGQTTAAGLATATTLIDLGTQIVFQVVKRATPGTITFYAQAGGSSSWDVYGAGAGTTRTPIVQYSAARGFSWYMSGLSGLTTNNAYIVKGHWTAEAEL